MTLSSSPAETMTISINPPGFTRMPMALASPQGRPAALAVVNDLETFEKGPDEEEHGQNVKRGEADGPHRHHHVLDLDDGDDQRQQAPRRHVGEGGAGDRQHADARALEVALGEDARE